MNRNVTRIRDLLTLGLFILGPCLFNSPAQGDFFRVDGTNGTCAGNGSGWGAQAFKYLQDALNNVNLAAGDQIWVAAGIYFVDQDCLNPDGTGDRVSTFQLVKDVRLLGGFFGNETLPEQRDPLTHITILSGAVAQGPNSVVCPDTEGCTSQPCSPPPQTSLDGCCCCRVCDISPGCCSIEWLPVCAELAKAVCGGAYHVVTAGAEITDSFTTIIDGFTIQDGTATGGGSPDQAEGGGMLITGRPSVIRCIFTNNNAGGVGGAVSIVGDGIEPQLINCEFRDNPGSQAGLVDHSPTHGGGLASDNANPTVTNCLFANNQVTGHGGAIYNVVGPDCPAGTIFPFSPFVPFSLGIPAS